MPRAISWSMNSMHRESAQCGRGTHCEQTTMNLAHHKDSVHIVAHATVPRLPAVVILIDFECMVFFSTHKMLVLYNFHKGSITVMCGVWWLQRAEIPTCELQLSRHPSEQFLQLAQCGPFSRKLEETVCGALCWLGAYHSAESSQANLQGEDGCRGG